MLHGVTPAEAPAAPVRHARRRRWPSVAVAGLLAVLVPVGWWVLGSSPLRNTFGGFGVSHLGSAPGVSFSVGIAHLCLDGADSATVDAVTVDPTGLTVVDFAVRPVPSGRSSALSSAESSLRELGFTGDRRLTLPCGAGDGAELAVEIERGELSPAWTEGFDVHWSAGLRSGVLRVPVQVALCSPQEAEPCEPWSENDP